MIHFHWKFEAEDGSKQISATILQETENRSQNNKNVSKLKTGRSTESKKKAQESSWKDEEFITKINWTVNEVQERAKFVIFYRISLGMD